MAGSDTERLYSHIRHHSIDVGLDVRSRFSVSIDRRRWRRRLRPSVRGAANKRGRGLARRKEYFVNNFGEFQPMVQCIRILQILSLASLLSCSDQESDSAGERRLPDGRIVVWTDPGCAIWMYGCENRCTTEEEREIAEADPEFPDADCVGVEEFPGDCLLTTPTTCAWYPVE